MAQEEADHHQTIEQLRKQNELLQRENRQHTTKLTILYSFVDMLRRAYDALLYHGVNYQSLPEYKRDQPLDALEGKPLEEAKREAVGWLRALVSGIDAAVRRKNLKVISNDDNQKPPTTTRH